jgi:benzoyl-CoA reductase/2-hydroxyglutaryl-CoA dehydratase subunit BcrC/BadD/HgdB
MDEDTSMDLLNVLQFEHYSNAIEKKEEGKPVGWLTSIFPQEIVEALDLDYVYPENQCCAVAARKESPKFIDIAEGMGYSVDLCAYARLNLGYCQEEYSEALTIPMPDFICCCNNICNEVIKWYENLAKTLNIPMIMVDIPFSDMYEPDEARVQYIKGQLENAITQLEAVAGKKMDYDKLREVMKISNENSAMWAEAMSYLKNTPSPMDGFSMFNYMAMIVCARGKASTKEIFEKLAAEHKALVEAGGTNFRTKEEFRVMWDGIAVWPSLGFTAKTLIRNGINMNASTYPDAFAISYDELTLEGMARGYAGSANTRCVDYHIDARAELMNRLNCDGAMYHMNRSCKVWDMMQYAIAKGTSEKTGKPYVIFDGDQADPRGFSRAQFETRVDGLREVMAESKKEGPQ